MKKTVAVFCLALSWLLPGQVMADPYVGHFVGELDGHHYRVTIDRVNSTTYDGILWIDDERMQLDARRYGERMSGRLADQSQQLGFRARIEGSILILETEDGRRLILRRSNPQ